MTEKLPFGVRRWYNSPSHAAEMTAGYYNYFGRCGYTPIAKALKQRRCGLCFTCALTPEGVRPHAPTFIRAHHPPSTSKASDFATSLL